MDPGVERPVEAWEPLAAPADRRPPEVVLFVDGVRRIDATVWVEQSDAAVWPGIAASYAAGVVRCDLRRGVAEVVSAEVRRGIFTASPEAAAVGQGPWAYTAERVDATDLARLSTAVQPSLSALEASISEPVREEDDLLVLDGPLRGRARLPRAVGYVKTHTAPYLAGDAATVIARLAPGQRTPIFRLSTRWSDLFSWYLRLPGPSGSPWAGIVRAEAPAELGRTAAVELADRCAVTLPRFASSPYKDHRAPQNLIPIAGLEGRLRRMLGDPRLLLRALATSATAGV